MLLIPDGPHETFEFAAGAFDLAERLQTPMFVMLDLDIGMNSHLCRRSPGTTAAISTAARSSTRTDLEAARNFGRYNDIDGDGMPYRTLPGEHPTRGAYFTRGTSRDRFARYTEELDALYRQHGAASEQVRDGAQPPAAPVVTRARKPTRPASSITARPRRDGRGDRHCSRAKGIDVDTLRIRAFPLHPEIADFVDAHETVFVVEQNSDAQMRSLMTSTSTRSETPDPDPAFRRPADHRALHRPAKSASRLPPAGRAMSWSPCRDLSRQAEIPSSLARGQRAGLYPSRLRRLDVDAVRRLRPRFDQRRGHARLLTN